MKMIVNADDFGKTSHINRAIVECFEKNIINSATLMANMNGYEEAVDLIHEHKLTDKIGIHLVLTEGDPITSLNNFRSDLFNGNLTLKERLKKLLILNPESKKLIFQEYSAQISKIQAANIPINHIDTHHQLHDMVGILQVILALLKQYNIPKLRILNNTETEKGYIKIIYRHTINYILRKKKINYSDYLGNQLDYFKFIEKNPNFDQFANKTFEIMVHPTLNSSNKVVDIISGTEYNISNILPT